MTGRFDRDFWEAHWDRDAPSEAARASAHPALGSELGELTPGRALDAGCGEGAEAIWLADRGWAVTGADLSARALGEARARAAEAGVDVDWVEADLSTWHPEARYDLVTTFYAHPTIRQLEFYDRIAAWVRPGGTLLIVGHSDTEHHAHGHGDEHARETRAHASVRAEDVVEPLAARGWRIRTAQERDRSLADAHGRLMELRDVVVRAEAPEPPA